VWWNGRHEGLKILWRQLRNGSSPFTSTKLKTPLSAVGFLVCLENGQGGGRGTGVPRGGNTKTEGFWGAIATSVSPAQIINT
jgi:hypothetical protein